jgi:beta-glucosidase
MIEKGIKPLLTLHHFSNPLWFEDMGSWTNPDSVDIFINFAKEVVEHLGDIVDEYITINEPNVYCLNGYFYGIWPPEQKSIVSYCKALSNMAAAHIKCYNLIHNIRADMGIEREKTLVSFANHLRVFTPKKYGNLWHRFCARFMEHMFQTAITDAMMVGKCRFPILRRPEIERGRYYDFIGINYYSRSTVSGIADGTPDGCDKNDLGWEIYHDGLIDLSNLLTMEYGDYPIYVTENGTCDNTDSFRSRFIYDQLKLISEMDTNIERYYHWSFTDNFEWREGEAARFGIVHCDYETQKRTVKNSGKFYSDIIKNQGVTDEAYKTFVEPTSYHK